LLITTKIKHAFPTLLTVVRKNDTIVMECDLRQFTSAK